LRFREKIQFFSLYICRKFGFIFVCPQWEVQVKLYLIFTPKYLNSSKVERDFNSILERIFNDYSSISFFSSNSAYFSCDSAELLQIMHYMKMKTP